MRFLGILVASLSLMAAALVAAAFVVQDRIVFQPDTTPLRLDPAALPRLSLNTIETEDGLRLAVWTVSPEREDAPTLLYLHGNAGNLMDRRHRLARLAERGWGVLMLEWRGYGGNPGSPSEEGLMRDARAALAAIRAKGSAPARTIIWGESLGSAIGLRLAAERPGDIAGLVLELPFTSVPALARLHYPWLSASWLLRHRFDSLSHIAAVRVPVLIMSGGRDALVPLSMGSALAAAAGGPVQHFVAPELGHEDLEPAGALEVAAAFMLRNLGLR